MVENSNGKTPLGSPGCRWEDNIKMDLKYTGNESVDCVHLA
jgi:hypothetical protein